MLTNHKTETDYCPTEKDRRFAGVWIPAEIYLKKDLNWAEKILLVEIDSLSKTESGCFATNKYFADFIGLSPGRITRMISKLKKLGLVEEVLFDGKRRVLKSCTQKPVAVVKNDYTPLSKTTIPPSRKRLGSIYIRNINTKINKKEHTHETTSPVKTPTSRGSPPAPKAPPDAAAPAALAVCAFLLQEIRKRRPNFREGALKGGERIIEKMIVEDGRDPIEIQEVIAWAFKAKDKFWHRAFLNVRAIRTSYERVLAEMESERGTGEKTVEKRRKYSEYVEREFDKLTQRAKNGRSIHALSRGIEFCCGGASSKVTHVSYNDEKFGEKINEMLTEWELIPPMKMAKNGI